MQPILITHEGRYLLDGGCLAQTHTRPSGERALGWGPGGWLLGTRNDSYSTPYITFLKLGT